MKNRLRIRAKSLNLDLVGEGEYIMRAYDAIHPVLVERFVESVEQILDEPEESLAPELSETIPMHRPVDPQRLPHMNVVVCNEVYNKIYLVDRDELRNTIFRDVIDLDAVGRIYINRSQRDRFRGFIRFGKVLWRELTSAGRAVVKGT